MVSCIYCGFWNFFFNFLKKLENYLCYFYGKLPINELGFEPGITAANVDISVWSELLSPLFRYGLPRWLNDKESGCNAGDLGLIPGSGRSPGVGNSNPLQYSCLKNPMDRWAIVPGVTKGGT